MIVTRRLEDIGTDSLGDLPAPCRACVYWESGRAFGPIPDGAAAKDAWWQATELEWGVAGRGVYEGRDLHGFVVLAPPPHFEGGPRTSVPSDDALLLATLWVRPDVRGQGVARMLVQAGLKEAVRQHLRAVEIFAAREPVPSCVAPESALLGLGFAVHEEDSRFPLLRLDLRQTVRWSEQVAAAVEQMRSGLRRGVPARSGLSRPQN